MSARSLVLFLELECLTRDEETARPKLPYRDEPVVESSDVAEVLASIIAPYAGSLDIVITDPGAVHSPLGVFRKKLPDKISANIVDSVYLKELTDSSWSDYHSALATRYACIRLWLDRRRPDQNDGWLALDRCHQLDSWPDDQMEHLVCGPLSNIRVQRQLTEKLFDRYCAISQK